jgi:FkbM family methyltransferase
VRESVRFAIAELRAAAGVRHYRLRDGTRICVRHGVTSWTLEEVFAGRVYDPPSEVSHLLGHAGGELSLIDLGGHAGYASIRLLSLFPSARITAYEPDPISAGLHATAIRMNQTGDRWHLVTAAAGSGDGQVAFVGRGTGGSHIAGPDEDQPPFTVARQDVLPALSEADLAKIDIEGGEWAILTDERLRAGGPRALVLEYHERNCPGPSPREEAIGRLEHAGYTIVPDSYPANRRRERQGLLWAMRAR